jgi:lipopolysaccharide export system protein LptA
MTLRCPRVDVRYDHVPHVTWAKGSGGVVAEVKGVRAEAPEVEVDLAARTMELRGGVRLTRGDGWITAERASVNVATGKVTMSDVKGAIPIPKPSP